MTEIKVTPGKSEPTSIPVKTDGSAVEIPEIVQTGFTTFTIFLRDAADIIDSTIMHRGDPASTTEQLHELVAQLGLPPEQALRIENAFGELGLTFQPTKSERRASVRQGLTVLPGGKPNQTGK